MMHSDMAANLAQVVVQYSTEVRPGDFVAILAEEPGQELVEAVYAESLRAGGQPRAIIEHRRLEELRLGLGSEAQLKFIDPVDELIAAEADVLVRVSASSNTRSFAHVPAERMALYNQAYGAFLSRLIERIGDGSLRYCLVAWPSQAAAQEAGMGFFAYQEMLYQACALGEEEPVGHWQQMAQQQARIIEWLADKESVSVRGPGIELDFKLTGRKWESAHGKLNFPDGEIYTGPVEESVEGEIHFNLPSLAYGQEVRGARLRFQGGTVVEASAEVGEAFLQSQLGLDQGARRLGEFAIGTNWGVQKVTGSTLLDEKIGGTIHLALGKSIPTTGGQNDSQIHWDMVHDMKEKGQILVEGELFYDSGQFMI
jgi:aminopeptidase